VVDETDFDALYRGNPDPFGVEDRWYEQRKQQVVLASLGQRRYRLAWDCASGTGHLSAALATRCESVVATDAAPTAVELTRARCRDASVAWEVSRLPAFPDSATGADLTVVPEVLYYLPDEARATTVARLARQRGELAVVTWRHHPDDAHISGSASVEELDAALVDAGWVRAVRHDEQDFVLATWTTAPQSTATSAD
jgi:ubiquinone/menaquinone biosynthesis C-methylase UbiE